jgi:lipoate-protein ligase A
VVGYANQVAKEVNPAACEAGGVPVLRRCSGGGTVLQGPGCLNYSLVLNVEDAPELAGITSANRFIMERNRAAMESVLSAEPGTRNPELSVEGHTDLAIAGRKFSGNAQQRKRTHLLHHGSLLYAFDFAPLERYLKMPARRPDYRRDRTHADFLMNLPITKEALRVLLRAAWQADDPLSGWPAQRVQQLVTEKYAKSAWIRRR